MKSLIVSLSAVAALSGCGRPASSVTAMVGDDSDAKAVPAGRTAAGCRFPVVLHHGLLGFDTMAGVDYFYRVRDRLAADGHVVYATRVSPANSINYRAGQLAAQIDAILAETGASRVNLVAHSLGGLDARYLISTLGYADRIASLTTVSTPHRGAAVADVALGLAEGDRDRALDSMRRLVGLAPGQDQVGTDGAGVIDLLAALRDLSRDQVKGRFNPANPDRPGTLYRSYAGSSSPTGATTGDALDPLLLIPHGIALALEGDNDGLVAVTSAIHGQLGGIVPADHLNEVGHPFGDTSVFFDHLAMYSDAVAVLARRGL